MKLGDYCREKFPALPWVNDRPAKPDWQTPSWLTTEEFQMALARARDASGQALAVEYIAMLAAMQSLESQGTAPRIVFWFDN